MRYISRALLLLLSALLVAVATPQQLRATPRRDLGEEALLSRFRFAEIKARDGVTLKANVIEPAGAGEGGKKTPAIVFINSWGLNDAEYLAQAVKFADRGYTVLSYTTRGFWLSGGQIDTAGPKDIADVSAALDWLVENTQADPERIGCSGISYGAGISLIASAFDSRIRSVAAMSGWVDLVDSLYGGSTRRPQAAFLLKALAQVVGKPSPELATMLDNYFANRNIDSIRAFGGIRSAASFIDKINANKPALLMANGLGDSIFAPNQFVDFFQKLQVPKRLEFAHGDHIIAEAAGLLGIENHVWDSVGRWFDHYLKNGANGIEKEPPLCLRALGSTQPEYYSSWDDVSTNYLKLHFHDNSIWKLTGGEMSTSPSSTWSHKIWTGLDTFASGGIALLTNGLTALTKSPPKVMLPLVDKLHAALWITKEFEKGQRIRGIPRVHLVIRPARSSGTVIAYLYDVNSWGLGGLFTFAPLTWKDATPGQPLTLDLDISATAYNVPAGNRVAIAIDTKDALFYDENKFNDPLIFESGSYLELPFQN